MKQTITRLAAVLGFVMITALCLGKMYDILRWKDTTGGYLSSIDQLYNTDDELIDLVFAGSSHCYHAIYPELLWKENGIAAFDMAVSAQDVDSTYYQLKELLKTQHPKVVVVDIYGICHEKHLVESNVYRNYLSMKTSLNSIQHVMSYEDAEERADLLARWPIIHTRYRELQKYDFVPYEPSVIGRGSLITWNTYAVDPDNDVNRYEGIVPLSERNQKWIQNLSDLAAKEDFELIFTLIAWQREDSIQAILNGFKEYIRASNIDFIDFTELSPQLDIHSDTDWADPEHLNARGAKKITRYLGDYIVSNYDLPDRRGDERYHQWDEALTRYKQLKSYAQLTSADSDKKYFSILAKSPRTTCVISLEGAYADSATDIYNYASLFHMEYEDYLKGGKWLYQDGTLTKLCDNDPECETVLDLNEFDTLKTSYSADFAENNIQLSGVSYQNAWSGMLTIVYDEIEKKVIGTKEVH